MGSEVSLTCAAMKEHCYCPWPLVQQTSNRQNMLTPLKWSQLWWCPIPVPPPLPVHPEMKTNLVQYFGSSLRGFKMQNSEVLRLPL